MLIIQQTPAVSRECRGELQVLDVPLSLAPKDFEFWTQLSTTHTTLWALSPAAECIKIRRTCSQTYTVVYLKRCWCIQCLAPLHMLLAFPRFEMAIPSVGQVLGPTVITTEVGSSCQISTRAVSRLSLKSPHATPVCTWNLDLRITFLFLRYQLKEP